MRRELRNEITARARYLMDTGAVDNRREALALADNMLRCGARTKSNGQPCRARPVPGQKRCRVHGGIVKPPTPEMIEAIRKRVKTQPRIRGRFARNPPVGPICEGNN